MMLLSIIYKVPAQYYLTEPALGGYMLLFKVTIAGHNMHVKSSWESVLQLAVLPNSSISSSSTSTPWGNPSTSRRESYRILGLRWLACWATVWGRAVEEGETRTWQTWFKHWFCSMARSSEIKRWFLSVSIFSPEKRKLSTPFSFLLKGCPVTTFHQIQRKTNMHADASQWFTDHSQYLLHN